MESERPVEVTAGPARDIFWSWPARGWADPGRRQKQARSARASGSRQGAWLSLACPRLAAAALLGILIGCAPAAAEERVKFTSAGQGDEVQGYLTKPRGKGPFPAVVLLHTCLGLPQERVSIGERIAAWGYVALFVDDFGTRGLKETCDVDFQPALADAYGALTWLSRLSDVDPARIAVVGFSQGGDTALKIAAGGGVKDGATGFRAAAAFYPPCANVGGARLTIPTLILVGARDDVTPAADCVRLMKEQAPGMAKLVVYPDAAHAFDLPGSGTKIMGMTLAYDRNAASRSWAELRAFLAARLGRSPAPGDRRRPCSRHNTEHSSC